MQNYLKLLSFLKDHRKIFSLAVVTMFIASLFEGIQLTLLVPLIDRIFNQNKIVVPNKLPDFASGVVDFLNAQEPAALLKVLPIGVLVMMVVKHVFVYCYQYLMNDVSQRVMRDIRNRLYSKILMFSLDYFSQKRTGELVSRITHDVQIIENAVSYGVTDLFRQTFLICVYLSISFSIHPRAAMVIFFVFPFVIWPINIIGKRLRKLATSSQERMADINSILLETISGIKVVKAFCTEQFEKTRFNGKNLEYYRLKMKTVKRLLFMSPITEIFGVICGVFIIQWLGHQVLSNQLSFGTFVCFLASILSIISPIKKLGNVNALTQQALSANQRVYAVLDSEPSVKESAQAKQISQIQENIVLKDVIFSYDDESGDVLKNINLEINVGELVAIVGPTGTGKSTLVNLIPRFYDPRKGVVEIDGINLKDVSFGSLRKQVGIVAQETFLFNDTVKTNICYGSPGASQDEIEAAAHKAYAHRFIVNMPQGYNTTIGDRGFRLSGGEKQRIAIARAILKNPPILILDEATSQLDSESEKFIQEALDELMQGRTVIAIAHRLSTIQKANKIVVLDKGQVIGMGKHEELLNTCELYQRLHKTQFQL